jgi:hypothetical protein
MTRLKLTIAVVVFAGAAAILWALQHQTRLRLREKTDAFDRQHEKLARLETENKRLSNLLGQATNSLFNLSQDLLKLRAEEELLRQQTNELQTLREQTQQLRAALKVAPDSLSANVPHAAPPSASVPPANPQPANLPPEVPPQNIYPRESWAFAGYATPEATVQSAVWAMGKGDANSFLAGFDPELRQAMEKAFEGTSFADQAAKKMNGITGFRIIRKDIFPDDTVALAVSMDGENDVEKMYLKKIDGQWKITKGNN